MWAAGVSLAGTLLVAALVNLCAVADVAKSMYGEQPPAPVEGVLVGAFDASIISICTAILMFVYAPRYRTTGKMALGVVVALLAAVPVVIGDIDVDVAFQLMDAML